MVREVCEHTTHVAYLHEPPKISFICCEYYLCIVHCACTFQTPM